MFSTVQLDMINGLVATMRKEGYLHYLAISDNYRASGYSYEPDLYIYFSKEEITCDDMYSYYIPPNAIKYSIRTGNGSNSNTGERLQSDVLQLGQNIDIELNEFVSTNAKVTEFQFVQPDFTVEGVGQYETQGALLFVVCTFLLLFAFSKFFRR